MSIATHPLFRALVGTWLGLQVGACGLGDIVLGERAGVIGDAASGSTDANPNDAADGGGLVTLGRAGASAAAGSDATGSSGIGGVIAQAGEPAPAGAPSPVPDAGAASSPRPVARPSSGCGKDALPGDTSVEIYGTRADYLLELPPAYDRNRAYALVLAFRGTDVTAAQFRAALNLTPVAGTEAVIVYANPVSETAAWEFTRDMPLVDALLSKLKSNYCLDEDRVYALGDGAGSLFVNLIACVRADQVRAVAPLSGAPRPPGPCLGNTALWFVQGDADPAVRSANKQNLEYWASRNSCDVDRSTPVTPTPCVEYTACATNFPVRYCEHTGEGLPGFAASGAWDFFESL